VLGKKGMNEATAGGATMCVEGGGERESRNLIIGSFKKKKT